MNDYCRGRFGLADVMRSAAVVFAGSVVLVPMIAGARPTGDDGLAKRLHLLGTAFLAYANDYDGRLPLAYAIQGGVWQTNSAIPTPADWRPSTTPQQREGYSVAWANSVVPYLGKAKGDLVLPRTTKHRHKDWDSDYAHPAKPWSNTSLSFNGLLHAWETSSIAAPHKFPMLWSAWGNVQLEGYAHTSPALYCRLPETEQHCAYRPMDPTSNSYSVNGAGSILFQPYGSMQVVGRTAPFINADSAVVFVKLGAVVGPKQTNKDVDPFTTYDKRGRPSGTYWHDGAHPWLFRPDRKD
jgi:hypothetical protein